MSTVVSYTATLRTRNKNSTSSKTGRATQEFYSSGDNYAGIILFSGMNLTGKVITGIQLTVTSSSSGYGASSSKTVYMNKARYQKIDGIFGDKTKAAVIAFQKSAGIVADGIVGPVTKGKLAEKLSSTTNATTPSTGSDTSSAGANN